MAKTSKTDKKVRSKSKKEVTGDTQRQSESSPQVKQYDSTSSRTGNLQQVEPVCLNCRWFQPGLMGPICGNPKAREYRQRVSDSHRGEDFEPKQNMRQVVAEPAEPEDEGLYEPDIEHTREAFEEGEEKAE